MTVVKAATLTREITFSKEESGAKDTLALQMLITLNSDDPAFVYMMEAAFNCTAQVTFEQGKESADGDPTEIALMIMAYKAGIRNSLTRVREIPFDSDRKRMSVVVKKHNKYLVFTKGALDKLIPLCKSIAGGGNYKEDINTMLLRQEQWAQQALQLLGFAYQKYLQDAAHLSEELKRI